MASATDVTVHDPVEDDFTPAYHVYGPHRVGLPNLSHYFRGLWRRREFAIEMSRAELRGANANTFFGQAWLVINPLLMASVYFVLVTIIAPGRGGLHPLAYFAHLTGALFAFNFVTSCLRTGATSVVKSGKLLLNTAFPRLLMPLSAVRSSFMRFLPTVPVYVVLHLIAGMGWHWEILLAPFFLLCMAVFGAGLAAFFATLQVYFRDTRGFLPFFTRMWLYLSPVLWTMAQLQDRSEAVIRIAHVNPMVHMLGGYSYALQDGVTPPLSYFVTSAAVAVGALVIGSLFFISRERDFAVRVI